MRIEKDQIHTLAILGGLAVVFALVLWLPLHLRSQQLSERIEHAEEQLGFDRQSTAGLGRLANDVVKLEQIVNGAQKYVPEQAELADFLRNLSTELNDIEVRDREVETLSIVDSKHYSIIPVNLRFRSSFPKVYLLLKQIESHRRLIRVNRLEIDTENDADADGLMSVRMELATFYSSPEDLLPSEGSDE